MSNIIEIENKYLDYAERVLDKEIDRNIKEENELKEEMTHLSFEDKKRGAQIDLSSRIFDKAESIEQLKKAKEVPYFGRIDYKDSDSDKTENIYIGKTGVSDNNNIVIYDWRSPVCGLYYDSEVGPVSYKSPAGIQKGDMLLKRQILIENGKLLNAVDTNLVTNDELLLPYLDTSTDNKMKTIIASIQKEQNSIIRADDNNIIVQGVAGSGKTSVALHRIAYLLYAKGKKSKSSNFLVLGPNDYFLNYISSVLPDLDTTPVDQKTFLELVNEYIGLDLSISSEPLSNDKEKQQMQKNIGTLKGSLEYKKLLDDYIQECFDGNAIVSEGFKIDGKEVFSAEEIRNRLMFGQDEFFNFDKIKKYFKNQFKDNKSTIFGALNREYRDIYSNLPKDDPNRKIAVQKSIELEKLLYEQGEKLLDKYFKSISKSCLSIYVSFISELDKLNTNLTNKEVAMLQKDTLKAIRKKQIPFEDLAALLYLNYRLTSKKFNYTNIVIDEAQDYSLFAYNALKNVFPRAKFNIYGDLAQSIYPYRSIKSWDEVNNQVFDNSCNMLELSKSYRTTIEITETANNVLNWLHLTQANPVIRHGEDVEFINSKNNQNVLLDKINEWTNSGYKTIAIICKDELEAQNTHQYLTNNGIDCKYISNDDSKYEGNIFVITVSSSKGLEFDCTALSDASNSKYNVNDNVDMHLLYVASTRALHELCVLYNSNITKVYEGLAKDKEMTRKLTK